MSDIPTEPEVVVDDPPAGEDMPPELLEEIYGPGNAPPPTITPTHPGDPDESEEPVEPDVGDSPTV